MSLATADPFQQIQTRLASRNCVAFSFCAWYHRLTSWTRHKRSGFSFLAVGMSYPSNPVTFSCFCQLVSKIRRVPPKKNGARTSSSESREMKLLKDWISWLKGVCPAGVEGTGVIFFRLLFPEEGVRRRCVFFSVVSKIAIAR